MEGKPIRAFELKKFDGVANKVTFAEIKQNMFKCGQIDIIPKEKIVKLNIRWGELYCKCSDEEWAELHGNGNGNFGLHRL